MRWPIAVGAASQPHHHHPAAAASCRSSLPPSLLSHLHSAYVIECSILMLLNGSIATRVVIVRIAMMIRTRLMCADDGLIACHGDDGVCVSNVFK